MGVGAICGYSRNQVAVLVNRVSTQTSFEQIPSCGCGGTVDSLYLEHFGTFKNCSMLQGVRFIRSYEKKKVKKVLV
jgi:hypothetical protein